MKPQPRITQVVDMRTGETKVLVQFYKSKPMKTKLLQFYRQPRTGRVDA